MIETHITTIIECDTCESQYEIDADLMVEMRLIDLDEIEERAEKECLRKGWIRRLIKGSPYLSAHSLEPCQTVADLGSGGHPCRRVRRHADRKKDSGDLAEGKKMKKMSNQRFAALLRKENIEKWRAGFERYELAGKWRINNNV